MQILSIFVIVQTEQLIGTRHDCGEPLLGDEVAEHVPGSAEQTTD